MSPATPRSRAAAPEAFIGVDVQLRRDLAVAILDRGAHAVETLWIPPEEAPAALAALVSRHARGRPGRVAVGIDAPRQPLPVARRHFWDGRTARWRPARTGDRGSGRHCEVVVSAFGLARPQWTPVRSRAPAWMRLGFALFDALAPYPHVHEVFPSAAYRQLNAAGGARLSFDLAGFAEGPKDMLDAHVAAYTVRELALGRGQEVGGGDGLGTIALPRRLGRGPEGVLIWPNGSLAPT